MPLRTTPLVNKEYYHIYNRGVAHQPTYTFKKDYERFLLSLSYYRFNDHPFKLSRLLQIPKFERDQIVAELETTNNKAVNIIAYCLMPNHFHLLIQQLTDGGISKYIKQITNSYTRYFNTKYERVGPLYQGAFKAVHIGTDEQLIHVSRYIHLNPLVSVVVKERDFLSYLWSSLQHFKNNNSNFVDTKPILEHFSSPDKYIDFVFDQVDYGKKLENIKHLMLEK